MLTEKAMHYFHEIYEDLPRQGPGDRDDTERALRLLPPLTHAQRILDIGCGSGAQTIDLARATSARIVAIDRHPPFVAKLERRIGELGLERRLEAHVGDMTDLHFEDGSFDVVWSEGAIFIMGFSRGLSAWRRLLCPGGHLVVSELCWFRENPAAELREFCGEGDAVTDVATRRRVIAENGYQLVGDFTLSAEAWWENYYVPLAARVERFRQRHTNNPDALAVAARSEHEIELFRKHPGEYGYVFFVMRRSEKPGL